jgi:hypothetical protein
MLKGTETESLQQRIPALKRPGKPCSSKRKIVIEGTGIMCSSFNIFRVEGRGLAR